jgi:hypothetical protein
MASSLYWQLSTVPAVLKVQFANAGDPCVAVLVQDTETGPLGTTAVVAVSFQLPGRMSGNRLESLKLHSNETCSLAEKLTLFELLDAPAVGITLTESFAMMPPASVSGLYLSHPQAKYFNVGRMGRDQIEDYAVRKGVTIEQAERWIG